MNDRLTAKEQIHQLAAAHNISHDRHSGLDLLAIDISRLSDAETDTDEIQWLLVELGRAGILTGRASTELHSQYLEEKYAIRSI